MCYNIYACDHRIGGLYYEKHLNLVRYGNHRLAGEDVA